jgi:uncharacterized protein YjbI with pentapeptide repeats
MRDSASSNSLVKKDRSLPELPLPNLEHRGYRVLEVLGRHLDDRRISYLAIHIASERQVVIREYHTQNGEADYQQYKSQIDRLKRIEHPYITPYLESFPVPLGFCLVRAYQSGQPISKIGMLPPEDLKTIGRAVLKILNYLQRQNPIIVHQNIKPENIIVDTDDDDKLLVYLTDFAFARQPHLKRNAIDPATGSPGFTPPEAAAGRPLSPAADVYSLGMGLICLALGRSSHLAPQIIGENSKVEFIHLLPASIHPRMGAWLEKMVEVDPSKRFTNALAAKSTLTPLPAERKLGVALAMDGTPRNIAWWKLALGGLFFLGGTGFLVRQVFFNEEENGLSAQQQQAIQQQAQLSQNPLVRLLEDKNCASCNLSGQNFSKRPLTSVNLNRAILSNTNFSGADLGAAIFQEADLTQANLNGANLQEAVFYGAKLLNADLTSANLVGAKLMDVKGTGGIFRNVNLSNSDIKNGELQQADLTNANLSAADLRNADLSYANLRGANLEGAILDGTKLTGATMPDGKIHIEPSPTPTVPITLPNTGLPDPNSIKVDGYPTVR